LSKFSFYIFSLIKKGGGNWPFDTLATSHLAKVLNPALFISEG